MSVSFDLYFNKIMLLCDTMVVKHDVLAKIMNQGVYVESAGAIYADPYDRTTWKYYMNLAGEYHQYDKERLLKLTDGAHEHMRIKVAGDFEPIEVDFTKDLISGPNADPATRNEYKYGSQYYKELVARYPDFEELILGILNPIDINASINAKDGEILLCGEYIRSTSEYNSNVKYYSRAADSIFNNVELIEDQESGLIAKLQNYCTSFLERWFNLDFVEVDDLYFQTMWAVMFSGMPMAVVNARLSATKTNEAHTYHIRDYLDSHGYLGRHVDHLNIDVIRWLYRNVEYLDASMGMQHTFDLILENVFTASGVPLKTYLLAHDSSDVDQGELPLISGYEMSLNMDTVGRVLDRRYDVDDLLSKESGLGKDNDYVQVETNEYIEFEGARSSGDNFNTKLLESVVVDYSNYIPYRIQDVLLNLWAYSISQSQYRGTAYVTHPTTGDRLQFTMLNAYILMVYCFNKGHSGVVLPKIPKVYVGMVPREAKSPHKDFKPKLTFDQFRELVPEDDISDREIEKIIYPDDFRTTYSSSTDFYGEVERIWLDLCDNYDYADYCQLINKSCYRHVVNRHKYWWGMVLDLPLSGMTYEQWFTNQNLDISELSSEELLKLSTDLFTYGTGYVENHERKLKEIQKSCIDVLKHYASYTVHMVANNESYAPMMSRPNRIKVDNVEFATDMAIGLQVPILDHDLKYEVAIKVVLPHEETFIPENIRIKTKVEISVDVGVPSGANVRIKGKANIPVNNVSIGNLVITNN